MGMFEIDEAAKVITKSIDPDAKVKFGAVIDESMGDEIRITVIATGFDEGNRRPMPVQLPVREEPKKPLLDPRGQAPAQPPMEARKPLFLPSRLSRSICRRRNPFSRSPGPRPKTPRLRMTN